MNELVRLTAIEKRFPRRSTFLNRPVSWVHAVDGVDLVINRGETVGLVGESGSGKTTLGRIMLGLVQPTAGEVLVEGVDFAKVDRAKRLAIRRKVQFVFQDPYSSLDPFSPVGDSVAEPLRSHRILDRPGRHARVGELLERVGLRAADASRFPREFSGGQLQRIAIARALALDPQLIMLDEPVSSLDVSTQAEVINFLRDIQTDLGVAYLFISHDLAVVDHVSTRIAVMYLGRIVEQGSAQAIIRRPKHPYTLTLLSAIPGQAAPGAVRRRVRARGDLPNLSSVTSGCRFHPRCAFAMDVCRQVDPPQFTAPDGTTVACHLHTNGPTLGGETVADLAALDRRDTPALHS